MAESDKSKNPIKKKPDSKLDTVRLKQGISHVESSGGKNLWNKNSSGTGKYQFLYNEIKHLPEMKGISREQFRDNPELQEKIMDMAIDDKLMGIPGLNRNARDLKKDYNSKHRLDELAAMSHFLGRQGARKYLRSIRDGVPYEVSDSKNNKSVEDYLTTYNKGIKGYQKSEPLRNRPNDVQYPAYDRDTNYAERVRESRPVAGRPNPDGTSSTVLMSQSDNTAYPTLFHDEGTWTELPWREAQQKAKQDNELYTFDNEQQASEFAEGSWKERSPVPNLTPSVFADGGDLNNNTMNNEKNILTEFGAGGSHEANPFGGIQQGTGANGKPNMVEQGETKKGSYIYSDRLTLDKDTVAKSGLPKKFIGKTFAEASKILNKPTKDNEDDRITMDTAKENLERLQASQEEFKASMMPPPQQQPQGQQGMPPQGQPGMEMMQPQQGQQFGRGGNMYAEGGFADEWAEKSSTGKVGAIAGGAGALMDMGMTAFGDTGIDQSGLVRPAEQQSAGLGAGAGALKGAAAGASFGPWGAAIGGVLGAATGFIGANKAKKEAEAADLKFDQRLGNTKNYQAEGGYLNANDGFDNNSYDGGGPLGHAHPHGNNEPFDFQAAQSRETEIPRVGARPVVSNITTQQQGATLDTRQQAKFDSINANRPSNFTLPQSNPNEDNDAGFNWGSMLRYAPAAMNAFQLATQKKPDVETLNKLDNRYKPQYVDEQAMVNRLQRSGNINEAIANTSGGSQGALRSNLLAAHLNKQQATSDAYLNATNINRAENAKGQAFDKQTDTVNLQQSNLEKDINAKNKGAYDTNKSKLLSQLGNDLGGVGLEELRKKYPELAGMDYDTQGRYISWIKSEEAKKKANKKAKK